MGRHKIKLNSSLIILVIPLLVLCSSKENKTQHKIVTKPVINTLVTAGDMQIEIYLPLLQEKRIGVVSNHTAILGSTNLVDSLLSLNINVVSVFSPEHGFRGIADAGEKVKSQVDEKTGLPIISLYGDNKKPSSFQLQEIDVLLFDIQDVGARFYTYISTLHYVMEAAAENNIPLIVLDRPNPNGHYVDGPILDKKYRSFVGLHPVPIVHGLTIGEYAQMINGEKWLANGVQCELKVVKCLNYTHGRKTEIKIAPSPNLPNMNSIYLYPSFCLFEGTAISVGRGTEFPFQQYGYPELKGFEYSFVPKPMLGAKEPKLEGKQCYGEKIDLDFRVDSSRIPNQINLGYLLKVYKAFPQEDKFFNSFFNLLAGTNQLQQQIRAGDSEAEIRETWKADLAEYRTLRKKYLLYTDFN